MCPGNEEGVEGGLGVLLLFVCAAEVSERMYFLI